MQKNIREIYRLLPAIAESSLHREINRQLPYEEIKQLANAGLGRARIPQELGGLGLSWEETTSILIDIAAADSAIPQALRGHFTLVEDSLETLRTQSVQSAQALAQAQNVINFAVDGKLAGNAWTEPGNGGTSTTAEPATYQGVSGYRVTGTKYYTTGSIFAQFADVTATHSETGEVLSAVVPLTEEDDAEAGSVKVSDDWAGFGQRLTGSGTADFKDVFVPKTSVKPFDRRLPYQTGLYQHFLLIVLAGIAKGAKDSLATQVNARTRNYSHANTKLVRDDPQNLQIVGELDATAFLATSAVKETGRLLDQAIEENQRLAGSGNYSWAEKPSKGVLAFELATSRAQVSLSQLVPAAVTKLFDALGASSTDISLSNDRFWRNARTVATHNPWIYKARQLGKLAVDNEVPDLNWAVGINKGEGK